MKRFGLLFLLIIFIGLLASCGAQKNTTESSADAIIKGKAMTINDILSAYKKQSSTSYTIKNINVTKTVNYHDYTDYTVVEELGSNSKSSNETFHIRLYSNKKTLKFLIETYLHQHTKESSTKGLPHGYLFYRNVVYVVSGNPLVYASMQDNIKELKVLYK